LISNVKDYVSLYSGPWNERIDDYIKLKELVNKIVAENIQQEVDKDKEG
jgi:predicted transcriptional regulator